MTSAQPWARLVAAIARRPGYRWWIVATVCVGAFLGQLDASIASLVLPTLERVFGAPIADVEWVSIAYLLTLASLVVVFGRLADMVGRKALYTVGFVVFILGSALCGAAPNLGVPIGARVLQAIGAAMLQANSVAIITAAVGRAELGRALGIQAAAQAVGLSVGPVVGGLLIATLGWRWVFYIAVPAGIAGALLGLLVLPVTPDPSARSRARRVVNAGPALPAGCLTVVRQRSGRHGAAKQWRLAHPSTIEYRSVSRIAARSRSNALHHPGTTHVRPCLGGRWITSRAAS